MKAHLSIRVNPRNPNHHLWDNNGTWWCHYTLHQPDFTKARIRESLRTNSLKEARLLRDARLARHSNQIQGGYCAKHKPKTRKRTKTNKQEI